MRFITWPAFTNAFIIFTVTLPSLIPAVNANYVGLVGLRFINPSDSGGAYFPGQESEITWGFNADVSTEGIRLTGYDCNLYLVDSAGDNYTLATGVPLVNSTNVFGSSGVITFPPGAIPGSNYFIDLESKDIGSWHSNFFTIVGDRISL
ncbi:hypothetical protein DFH94DRAFT_782964, partial [Russula ochroleuca]